MKVNNYQIAGLVNRARRFRVETVKAASSALASMSDADFGRAQSYLHALTTYVDWVVSAEQLDLPESTPREIELGEPEAMLIPENEAISDMLAMYDIFEIEVGNCQSARLGDSIISHDEGRIRGMIAKMEQFLENYVSQVQPLDVPESSPMRPSTGSGRSGI